MFKRIAQLMRLRRQDRHTVRTQAGAAHIYTVAGPDGAPVRVLEQGGVWQSATYLDDRRMDPVFAYYRAFDHIFEASLSGGRAVRRALMLGGGGYAYPKYALTTYPGLSMDVAEIDPAVVAAAREYFFLDELEARVNGGTAPGSPDGGAAAPDDAGGRRLNLITLDGRAFLDAAARKGRPGDRYDAVINDTFCGAEPARALATAEALRAAKACLAPGGLYLANTVSRDQGADVSFLRDLAATASAVFRRVHVIPCTDEAFGGEDNYLLIATDSPAVFSDAVPFGPEFLGRVMHDEPGRPLRGREVHEN